VPALFKINSAFENWSENIKKSEENLLSQDSTNKSILGNLKVLKQEFDENLTKFYDHIENKYEKEILRMSDSLTSTLDDVRFPDVLKKAQQGGKILPIFDSKIQDSSEEIKFVVEQKDTSFQGDSLSK